MFGSDRKALTDAEATEIVNTEIDEQQQLQQGFEQNKSFMIRFMKKHVRKDFDYVCAVSGGEGCQPAGSKVMLADGSWKNIEDIKIGDMVLSPQHDGTYKFSNVVKLYKWFSKETYNVHQLHKKHKKLYSCSYNHEFPINIKKNRKTWEVKNYKASDFYIKKNRFTHNTTSLTMFPVSSFFNRNNCEIEPYTLGVWLGDGHFSSKRRLDKNYKNSKYKNHHLRCVNKGFRICRSVGITSNNPEIIGEISKFYDIMNIYQKLNTTAKTYTFSMSGILSRQLIKYGLEGKNSGTKFIPKEALYSDISYRKRLLAGMIDTDGYLSRGVSYSICTKSEQMANDIEFLVYSLGGRCSIRKIRKGIKSIGFIGEYFNISFYLGNVEIPLKVKRKIRNRKFFYLSASRTSIKLEKDIGKEVYGITVSSPSHWYITDNFMITKNTGKSAFAIEMAMKIKGVETTEDKLKFMEYNVIYDPSSHDFFEKITNCKNYEVFVIDEAMSALYKRNYGTGDIKKLNILFSKIRKKNLILFMCIPDFYDLDKYYRQHRVKTWFFVPIRGLVLVFKKSNSPFAEDKWEQKRNQKMIDSLEEMQNQGKLFGKTDMVLALRKSKSYGLEFTFGDFDPAIREIYEKYKEQGGPTPKNVEETMDNKTKIRADIAKKLFLSGSDVNTISTVVGVSPATIRGYIKVEMKAKKEEDINKKKEEAERENKKDPILL
jgi:hypothetical protein